MFGLLVLPCTDVVVDGRSITEFCTPKSCPVMSAGPKYEYLWADGNKIKKPIKVSAPEYVDYLMTWVQEILDDESVFPSRVDVPFPRNFMQGPPPVLVPLIEYRGSLLLHCPVVKNIFKRLFRVYAHIYYSHFQKIGTLSSYEPSRAFGSSVPLFHSDTGGGGPSEHMFQALLLLYR